MTVAHVQHLMTVAHVHHLQEAITTFDGVVLGGWGGGSEYWDAKRLRPDEDSCECARLVAAGGCRDMCFRDQCGLLALRVW